MKRYSRRMLLKEFIRFGAFTFGGGWSIIAQMQERYVEEKKLITSQELVDIISMAKTLPGVMIANVAMIFGCQMAGLGGGLAALLGMTTPPFLVMIVISFFYKAFRENYWVIAAMAGAQAAVVPVILSAAANMIKGSLQNRLCVAVTAVCALLYFFAGVSAIVLVLIGMASGLLISEYQTRKEASDRGIS